MSTAWRDDTHQGMFQRFFKSEVAGSVVLLGCTLIALFWANSPWADIYFKLTHVDVGVSWGDHSFKMSLGHWVGDGLMAIFFFVVGLEIKREIAVGQLSSKASAILPVSAAVGGMVVPAIIYAVFNHGTEASAGWGVPMATDIAFALGILALFGSRAPIGLKVFLTALAIADDLGAVMVIALFYTDQIVIAGLLAAALGLFLIWLAGRRGVRRDGVYVGLAIVVWVGVMVSGVHATIAGILVAMLVPVRSVIEPGKFLEISRTELDKLEAAGLTRDSAVTDKEQLRALDNIYLAAEDMRPAGISLEHQLHPVQAFVVLPLFALFKAGVPLNAEAMSHLTGSLGLGIILGLFVGKQIGVTLFSWLAIRSGRAIMPEGVTWGMLWGASVLAGVGFTMSIFVSELAFGSDTLVAEAKIAILFASLTAGIVGYVVLARALRKPKTHEQDITHF